MRAVLLFLLFCASNVWSWECLDGYSSDDPPEKHISLASDIIYGQVLSGNYDPENDDIKFEVKIAKTFKGKKKGSVELSTNSYAYFNGIVLGMNYLFYLYGSTEIDFCGVVIPYTPFATEVESLGVFAEEPGYLKAAIDYSRREP